MNVSIEKTIINSTMDDLGNRASTTLRDGSSDIYAVDTQTNRYTAIDSASLAYDDAGSLTTDKDGYHYVYDYENRPVRVYKLSGQTQITVATFDYDTQSHRIRKVDSIADTTTLYYYSDNWQVLAEYNGSGTLQAYYAYGNYIDEVLFMRRSNADFFNLHDHLYSPAALLDNTGSVVERYEYDAYGKATIWNEALTTMYSISQFGNHVLFTGREVDQFDNGSLTMQYNRNRYLSQYMGRWFKPDPLGYVDGLNLYEYVKSDPILHIDPKGDSTSLPGAPYRFGWYKLGTEDPGTGYYDTASDRYDDYGIFDFDESDPYITGYIKEVKARTKMQIASWHKEGYHYAARMLDVYATNLQPSGSFFVGPHNVGQYLYVWHLPYGQFINSRIEPKEEVLSQAANVKHFINRNMGLSHGSSISASRPTGSTYPFGYTDAFLAFKGHETWHKAENIKCDGGYLRAKFTTYLRDVYDFEFGPLDLVAWPPIAHVSPGEMQAMHRYGVFRAYFVYGEASANLTWKVGDDSFPIGLSFR